MKTKKLEFPQVWAMSVRAKTATILPIKLPEDITGPAKSIQCLCPEEAIDVFSDVQEWLYDEFNGEFEIISPSHCFIIFNEESLEKILQPRDKIPNFKE